MRNSDLERAREILMIPDNACRGSESNNLWLDAANRVAQALAEERQRVLDLVLPVLKQCYNYSRCKDEMNSHWHGATVNYREMTVRLGELLEKLRGLG